MGQANTRVQSEYIPHVAGWDHELAGGNRSLGQCWLSRLLDFRILSPLPALPRGTDLSDCRRTEPDARADGVKPMRFTLSGE